jgi:two-component system sensor histidine kinase KdpD
VLAVAWPVRGSQRLVRAAWRAARRLGAELDVVCPEGRLDEEGARQRDLMRGLAVTLGAHFHLVPSEDLADAVIQLIDERGITRVAMATPARRGLVRRLRGDLLDTVLERTDGVDVLLLADRRPEPDREER